MSAEIQALREEKQQLCDKKMLFRRDERLLMEIISGEQERNKEPMQGRRVQQMEAMKKNIEEVERAIEKVERAIEQAQADIKKQEMVELVDASWTHFLNEVMAVDVEFLNEQYFETSIDSSHVRFHCLDAVEFVGVVFARISKAKFPMTQDVLQRFSSSFSNLALQVQVVPVTLQEIRNNIPPHNLQFANEKLELYLQEILDIRMSLVNGSKISENLVQNFYKPLFGLLEHIMRCILPGAVVKKYEMAIVGDNASVSRNFIMPARKPDFVLTTSVGDVNDAIVLASMELKSTGKRVKGLKDLVEAISGPEWAEYLYYDVNFFFAFTGDAHGCQFYAISNKGNSECRMDATKTYTVAIEYMGMDTVYKFLMAILYNYRTFSAKILSCKPYTMIQSEHGYWINPAHNSYPINVSSVAIRISDKFPPWVEKSVPYREDLSKLCDFSVTSKSEWCSHLSRVIGEMDLMRRTGTSKQKVVVAREYGERVLRFTPAGHHPSCTVETIDHVRMMSDHVLKALQFLHEMRWVHGAPHLHSVMRTSESNFVLADWEAAQKISVRNGTAAVPRSATSTTCAFVSGNMKPIHWRPFYDIKVFIGSAINTAAYKVIERMVSQVASDVKKMNVRMGVSRLILRDGAEEKKRLAFLYRRICAATGAVIDLTARSLLLPKFLDELQEQDEAQARDKKKPLTASSLEYVVSTLFEVSNKEKYMTNEEIFLEKLLEPNVDFRYTDTNKNVYQAYNLLLIMMNAHEIDVSEISQVWRAFEDAVRHQQFPMAIKLMETDFFESGSLSYIVPALQDVAMSEAAGPTYLRMPVGLKEPQRMKKTSSHPKTNAKTKQGAKKNAGKKVKEKKKMSTKKKEPAAVGAKKGDGKLVKKAANKRR